MSRIITNTNVIVDYFDFCKSFPKNTFQHFLTHFHSDHYEGLSPNWDYGPIHCTHQTRKFLMHKFPKLQNVHSYDYYKTYSITLVEEEVQIQFTFFDAKHIPGAAMILFRGYMGTILFTGDFRYEYAMVKENSILFPPRLRQNKEKQDAVERMSGISIKVDEMVFDNTYCNKAFKFETEPFIADKIIAIIQKNKDKKLIYIAMGALGKHRILMKICQHFQTLVVVTENQKTKVELANLRADFLTTNPNEGFIHLINKKSRQKLVFNTKKGPLGDSFICIDIDFLMLSHESPDRINYIVPYSLHSNYSQMETFIRMVSPCILRKIVNPFTKSKEYKKLKLTIKIDNRLQLAKYFDYLEHDLAKDYTGYSYLVKSYTSINQLSKNYLQWFHPHEQKKLMFMLGLGDGTQDLSLRKRKPIFLREQQICNHSHSKTRKSLKDIAALLNAVNKNQTIQSCFEGNPNKNNQRKFNSIFEERCQMSRSRQKRKNKGRTRYVKQ